MYLIEIYDNDNTYTWEVKIDNVPTFKNVENNFREVCRGSSTDRRMPQEIKITFLENLDEKNLFRREVLFEKIRFKPLTPRRDSELLINIARFHLFMGGNYLRYGGGSLTNKSLNLLKINKEGTVISVWRLTNITVTDSSFLLNPFITTLENHTITILPESFWIVY